MLMTDWNPTSTRSSKPSVCVRRATCCHAFRCALRVLIYDLGCGPGNSAELLLQRFANARLIGLDTSDAMLAHARVRAPRAEFFKEDIASWTPEYQPDLIFANAALQFLPEHERLFPRLMSYLAPGGALAAQMPNTSNESRMR